MRVFEPKHWSDMSPYETRTELEISVLVVEDEALTRTLISKLLSNSGFRVVGAVADAVNAMILFREHRPQVVMIDIDLGGGPTGLDIAQALRKLSPRVGLIFVSSIVDSRTISPNLPPMPAGSIYVNKADVNNSEQLIELVQRAFQVIQSGVANVKNPAHLTIEPFTDVQLELMRMISLGMSNAAIAAARYTTIKSTENSIARLAKKLNIPSESTNNQRVLIARAFYRLNASSKLYE